MQPSYDDPNPEALTDSDALSESGSLPDFEAETPHDSSPKRRLITAMLAYAILAVLAGLRLDGRPRLVVWIFLGLFAVKTLLVVLKRQAD